MPLCVMSELLRELVHHWDDVISVFLNTVHVDLLSATGDLHMRFALWSIIMQIGEKNIFLSCSSGSVLFCVCSVFVGSNIRFDLRNILQQLEFCSLVMCPTFGVFVLLLRTGFG